MLAGVKALSASKTVSELLSRCRRLSCLRFSKIPSRDLLSNALLPKSRVLRAEFWLNESTAKELMELSLSFKICKLSFDLNQLALIS